MDDSASDDESTKSGPTSPVPGTQNDSDKENSASDDDDDDVIKAKKPAIDSDDDSEDEAIRKKRKSDFLKDSEAEEDDSDEEVAAPKKKKTKTAADDEDDEEDDVNAEDADEDGNIKGLIASSEGEVDDSDDESGSHRKKKKKRKRRLSEERLDDDDLALIEENIGVRIDKGKKFSRLKIDSDSEGEIADKDKIAEDIFQTDLASDDEDQGDDRSRKARRREKDEFDVGSDDNSGSDEDGGNFIVDDKGNPIKNRRAGKSRGEGIDDEQLREAHDIFGPDFDPNEFGSDNEQDDDGESYDEDEDGYGGERRSKKRTKENRKTIYDVYTPDDLERGYYTDYDRFLREQDLPERFLDRAIAVEDCECMTEEAFAEMSQIKKMDAIERELEKEARWIYENAFGPKLTNQEFDHPVEVIQPDDADDPDKPHWKKDKPKPKRVKTWADHGQYEDTGWHKDDTFIYQIDWQEAKFSEDPAERERYIHEYGRKHNTFLYKIFKCLYNIRVQKYEPAFINMYRQEEMVKIDTSGMASGDWYDKDGQPTELPNINEENKDLILWKESLSYNDIHRIFRYDEKYLKFLKKKKALKNLFQKMQDYQYDLAEQNMDLPPGYRSLKPEDIDKIDNCNSIEELDDHFEHFQLYHGRDIQKMNEAAARNGGAENEYEGESKGMKQSQRNADYNLCLKNKLHLVAKEFGLSPEQFAEHVKDEFSSHDILQEQEDPDTFAAGFITDQFDTPERVLKGARYMAAQQLACEPDIRKKVRKEFENGALISTKLTKKGEKFIDEDHALSQMRFLEDKPIRTLERSQFIQLIQGEQEKFIELKIYLKKEDSMYIIDSNGIPEQVDQIADNLIQLYWKDQHDLISKKWNEERKKLILELLNNILYPNLIKKLKLKLIEEAEDGIIAQCREKFKDIIKQGPIINLNATDAGSNDGSEADWDRKDDGGVLAFVAPDDMNDPVWGVVLKRDGEVSCYRKYPMLLMGGRRMGPNHPHHEQKMRERQQIGQLLQKERPQAIIIAAKNNKSNQMTRVMGDILAEAKDQMQTNYKCAIELRDPMVPKVFAVSKRAQEELPNFPQDLREAISLGRMALDPAVEVAQLFNQDDDVLCLQLSPFQTLLRKDKMKEGLKTALEEEMQYQMCEIGVDINKCVAYPHQARCLQFVAGLGPRKADGLVKHYKRANTRLETLDQLISDKGIAMRKFVFINCSGFIKIDTTEMGDSGPDIYIEVLDGSRIHPEHYPWARKMAVDAMCNEDDDPEEANDMEAIEAILDDPAKLSQLDLEIFNSDIFLQNQRDINSGNKILTLFKVRDELYSRFKDKRLPHRELTPEEKFHLLTGESSKSFYVNKMVTGTVSRFIYKPVDPERKDVADPERVPDAEDQWMCPFCKKKDFFELSQVWSHFDATDEYTKCPGEIMGVELRLENGLLGVIRNKDISSSEVIEDPTTRMAIDQVVTGRITQIDHERFKAYISTKSEVLRDEQGLYKLKDDYYTNSMMKEKVLGEYKRGGSEKQRGAIQYNKRVIAHENFFNLNYAEAVLKLKQKDQGDCIIRPSSKGTDHLTASWKMHTDIINHVDILERDKPNAYSLGKSLFIDEEVFEDLDEIIANFIEPMASNARDLLNHKNFVETGGCRDSMEALIKKAKKENGQRIPYYVTACGKAAKNPAIEGKFMLSFWPSTKQKIRHEFITATPNGFRYRQIVHNTTANLFKYFKNHYTETPPPAPNQKERQQNQLASLIKNLNVEQVQKLKKMNDPNPHYTPSDLDNVAHTPSELPFQSRPRVSMSRVGDDKDDFKRPSGFGGKDRDNDSRGSWGSDRRGGGRGGRGGRGDRGGFSENKRQPDRSPDPNRSDKGWGSSGGGGGWGSNDRDKGRSPPRSRGRNNVWGDDNDDKRGGDRRPRGGGRGRGRDDNRGGGRGRGGRGGRGGGGRDGGSWGGNRDRGSRGGGSTPSLSRVHSPPRGGSWGNRSPPRMERRQSPPSYSKSPGRGGGGWGNASPPAGGASGSGGWGGSTPRKSPPSSSGWGGSGKATPRKSSPDRSTPSGGGGGWGSPAKSPGPSASWGSPAKKPEKEKSKGWGSPSAATAGSQSPAGW